MGIVDDIKTVFQGGGPQGQIWTWYGHGLVTVLVAWTAGMGVRLLDAWWWPISPLLTASVAATLTAAYYVLVREPADKAAKKKAGTWHDDMGHGITGMVDGFGDSMLPVAVAVAFWAAWTL